MNRPFLGFAGAKAFGPVHRDWSSDLPRKVRQLGLKVALSARLREGRLSVVDEDGLTLEGWVEKDGSFGASNTRSVRKVLKGELCP